MKIDLSLKDIQYSIGQLDIQFSDLDNLQAKTLYAIVESFQKIKDILNKAAIIGEQIPLQDFAEEFAEQIKKGMEAKAAQENLKEQPSQPNPPNQPAPIQPTAPSEPVDEPVPETHTETKAKDDPPTAMTQPPANEQLEVVKEQK